VEHCFGAAETTWGILSGGYYGSIGSACQFRLEITLAELIEDHQAEAPAWCKRLSAVTRQLLNARNAAVNGDHTLVETLTNTVAEAAATGPQSGRFKLAEHLPGPLRPIPDTLSPLLRIDSVGWPIIVYVSQQADATIELHDIVVGPAFRGSGLGTAALIQLARYADHHRSSVVGKLGPGHNQDPAVLTAWYHHHGFQVSGKHLRRTPQSPRPA